MYNTAIVSPSWDCERDFENLLAVRQHLQSEHPTVPLCNPERTHYFWLPDAASDVDDLHNRYGAPSDFMIDDQTFDTVVLNRVEAFDPESISRDPHVQLATANFIRAHWVLRLVRSETKIIVSATCGDCGVCIDHSYLGDLPGYWHTRLPQGPQSDFLDLYFRNDHQFDGIPSFREALKVARKAKHEASRDVCTMQ